MAGRISLLAALAFFAPLAAHADVTILATAQAKGIVGERHPQPVTTSVSQLTVAMEGILYARHGVFSEGKERRVFDDLQIQMLATKIQQRLQQPAPVTGAGAEVADVEARIHALKRFLDKGLITAVEHRIKLDALIAEYQANHPLMRPPQGGCGGKITGRVMMTTQRNRRPIA